MPALAESQLGSCAAGAPGGSGQLGTPRKRPAYRAPSHCLGCSSWPPPKPPISPPPLTIQVEAVGSSTIEVFFFGTQQLGKPKKTDVLPFASRDATQAAGRGSGVGLNAAIAEAQASLL